MEQISSIDQVYQLIATVKSQGKEYLTNFFLDIPKVEYWLRSGVLKFTEVGNSVFLFRKNNRFFNLFYIAPEVNILARDMKDLLAVYSSELFVADLISASENQGIKNTFFSNSFHLYTTLVRMSRRGNGQVAKKADRNLFYADLKILPTVTELFSKYFDPYCEQIPADEELSAWVNNKELVIYSNDKDRVQGFVIFEKIGQTAYLRYWFVHPDYRDKGIGSDLLNKFFTDCLDSRRQIFWVVETNENAIKRYEHFGFKKESLVDNIYINRSWKYGRQNN
jgi:ribosomal protein S18 acetylase RimI-like enzyme